MAVPGLKDFTKLIGSARSEFEAWSVTPAATGAPASSLDYIRDVLPVLENSDGVYSLAIGLRNVMATVESLGVRAADVSPPLVRLSGLLDEREQKDPHSSSR